MSKDDGGSAFPGLHPSKECLYQSSGMSLRDYFAGQALLGLGAASDYSPGRMINENELASDSYAIADAMLKERSSQ